MIPLAFLALIPRFLLGFLITHFIWTSKRIPDLVIKVFLALPAGVGVSSLLSFIWIWAKMDLRIYIWVETFLTVLVTVFIVWKNRHNILSVLKHTHIALPNRQSLIWITLFVVSAILFTSFFWIDSVKYPHGKYDAWTIWNVVARFVYRGGENWQGTFLRPYTHPDYPFLLAMSNATTWTLLNKEVTYGPILLAFFFMLSLVGLLFGLLNELRDSKQASIAAILLMTQPVVAYHGMSLIADLPETFYFLASAGLMPLFLSHRDKSLAVIAGLMAGLAAWTKNEGMAFAAVNLIAWVGIGIFLKERLLIRNFLFGISLPMLVVILFKILLAPQNDLLAENQNILAQLFVLPRYIMIIKHAAGDLWNFGIQPVPIAAALFIYMLLAGRTRNSIQVMLPAMFAVSAQLLVYFFIYVITPLDLEWHLGSSLGRLYLHLFPLALLCLFLWVKTPDELKSQMEDNHAPHH